MLQITLEELVSMVQLVDNEIHDVEQAQVKASVSKDPDAYAILEVRKQKLHVLRTKLDAPIASLEAYGSLEETSDAP